MAEGNPNLTDSDIELRAGKPEDWAGVEPIVAQTWDGDDYIAQPLWQQWASDNQGHLVVAEKEGQIVGLCKLSNLGPAEWWLEGARVDPTLQQQGIGQQMTDHLLRWFRRYGTGILRLSTYSENEASQKLIGNFGFRHILSLRKVAAPAITEDFRNFKLLQRQNIDLVRGYLRRSPLRRVNRFIEHYWKLYFLTDERLEEHLDRPDIQVLGWRQDGMLSGLAVVMLAPPIGREPNGEVLHMGFIDALDDTTLRAMLLGLRGLAAHRGLNQVEWKMPASVGLERAVEGTGFEPQWDGTMNLYELPLRANLGG